MCPIRHHGSQDYAFIIVLKFWHIRLGQFPIGSSNATSKIQEKGVIFWLFRVMDAKKEDKS